MDRLREIRGGWDTDRRLSGLQAGFGARYNAGMAERYCYSYPRPALTVDVVLLTRDGFLLLVKRKKGPFRGRWALPGGFVGIDERLAEAAARELAEETGLSGLELRQFAAFDEPGRDPRGRTIAVVFLGWLPRRRRPRGGSDAAAARWFSIDRIPLLAFDHADVVACARAASGLQAD